MIEIIEVRDRDLDEFITFPITLHAHDSLFVPPLMKEMRMQFSDKNPFFMHADAKYLLAKKGGKTVGRMISFMNRRHNQFHKGRTGFFGFFDSANDASVATALFDTAATHLRDAGMSVMRGPMNFTTNEECGFLLEGFHEPPMLMTPYNPPYYNDLASAYGFRRAKDLYGYIYAVRDTLPEKILRVAAIGEKRGIKVRHVDKAKFHDEMLVFKNVYNEAWQENWGFIPLTDEELYYLGERLRKIAVPELILIAEDKNGPVGFLGHLPDFNFVLKHMRGKVNPLTILKALYYSRKIADLRLLLLGIKSEYRNKGVDALLFREGFKAVRKGGYRRVEFSWILEDNTAVQRLVQMIGGECYKKYRIYEKSL